MHSSPCCVSLKPCIGTFKTVRSAKAFLKTARNYSHFCRGWKKNGGWPYIPRLQLRTFIDLLGQDSTDAAA